MFGKNKNVHAQSVDVSQGTKSTTESFVVHTMADDLARGSGQSVASAQKQPTVPISQEPSPFLQNTQNAKQQHMQVQQKVKLTEAQPILRETINEQVAPKSQKEKQYPHSKKGGSGLVWVLIMLLVAIAVAIAWFTWQSGMFSSIMERFTTQKTQIVSQDQVIANDNVSEKEIANTNITVVQPYNHESIFSHADTALRVTTQTVVIDIVQKIKELANMQSGEVSFVVDILDENGTPLSFALFAKRFLPNMPVALLTTMDQAFQLYVLPHDTQKRIGIHTHSLRPNETRDELRGFETTLLKGLAPLFLFTAPPVQSVLFEDNVHHGVPIRFYNFTPDTAQSVDYATHYEHVFFGTSRATMRMMMDIVFAQDAVDDAVEEPIEESVAQVPVQTAPITGAGGDVAPPQDVEVQPEQSTAETHAPPAGAPPGWQP